MKMRRDEWFQLARWFNLVIGLYNLYYYVSFGNWALLALGGVNIAVFVFSRKIKERSYSS
jgi:hypothetical protein